MGRHSGSHHSSSSRHSGSHHSSSSRHSGSHHSSSSRHSGSGSGHSGYSCTSSRRSSVYKYRSSDNMYYSDAAIPERAIVYNGSWYQDGTYGSPAKYGLNMDDPYVQQYYDASKTSWYFRNMRTPGRMILSFYLFFFSLPLVFGICGLNILYELIIPIFENMDLTDFTFWVIDEGLYLIQYVPAWLWIIGVPVFTIKGYKKSEEYERAFTKEMLDYYGTLAQEKKIEYLSVCPACGASVDSSGDSKVRYCSYCGHSLRADGMQ